MSECFAFSSSMTGSTNSGPLPPPKDSSPLVAPSLPFERYSTAEAYPRRPGRKMTLTPPSGQPIQLTPLWEHVVRTRRFPTEVDTRLTFLEISERLRDPEWEVRQHALRVLIDVIPTLNNDIVDKVMQPVVPELINNLGHPAPAVRKGALDALRVFLVHCRDREETVKKILEDGLNRAETRDPFQTNVTTGVILSAPSLLFPSSSSPSPASQLIKDTTIALASRLAQVPHQEAVLKSLMKIRDAVGDEKFENYLADYDNKLTRNIEILSKIYNVKPCKKSQRKISADGKNAAKREKDLDRKWESDSDTSGIAEEEEEASNTTMPPGRVVLETEIKFNEETAITMTILEEKEEESGKEQDEESGTDVRNEAEVTDVKESLDRRKTPRRVHFGGEIVKLRTPDSEDTESIEATPKTRIPLPVSPATKMPERPRRPSSQPCSPRREKRVPKRTSRSVSSSPRREVYTHNAELSPKKSILTRTNSPVIAVKPVEPMVPKRRKNSGRQDDKENDKRGNVNEASEGRKNGESFEAFRKIEEFQKPVLGSGELTENISAGKNSSVRSEKREGGKEESLSEKSNWKTDAESGKDTLSKMSDDGKLENCGSRIEEKTGEKNNLRRQSKSEETSSKRSIRYEVETKAKVSLEDNSTIREKKVVEDKGSRRLSIGTKTNDFMDSRVKNNESEGNVVTNVRIERSVEGDSMIDNKVITESFQSSSSKIDKPPLKKSESALEILVNESESVIVSKESAAISSKRDNDLDRNLKNGVSVRDARDDRDKRGESAIEKNLNVVAEADRKLREPSWEELGLVEEEVLEDLHNKDDWRARVRGFERVASALRTSSALIAIEGRLGSLLHAVLGCERSCRVAAAGLAVAKVVVAGVNEEALKKRLPQLAWGLARQGGPNAAQLARIAMLRLRPALLLEQLLQPQCLNARNAKTRENALQLLIFSLVTFPSTEFKVEIVANKVAKMVGDRRRRVRQAALDTLAVLAQIYEPEEVLAAGKRGAEGRHDGEAMIAAIRSRLARKSLPLVSADGLVVYGLQISPTVQIATGPDVDWIVAGSGSVSPGTGRTRGQVITATPEKARIPPRNSNAKNRDSPWIERPNFVALGVGMRSRGEHPVAWQIVRTQNEDNTHCDDQLTVQESRRANAEIRSGKNTDSNLISNDLSRSSAANRESANYRNIVENNFEHRTNFRTVDVADKDKETVNKAESRIPVPFARERGIKLCGQVRGKSANMELAGANSRNRKDKDSFDSIGSRANNRADNIGSHSAISQRRKRFLQENSGSRTSGATETLDQSPDLPYNNYHAVTATKHYRDGNKNYSDVLEDGSEDYSEIDARSYQKIVEKERLPRKCDAKSRHSRSNSTESQLRSSSTSVRQQTFLMHEMYSSRRDGRFIDENVFRPLQTAPTPLIRFYTEENFDRQTGESSDRNILSRARYYRRTADASAQKIDEVELVSTDAQTNEHFPAIHDNTPCRRRLRSLSPTQLCHRQQFARMVSNQVHAMSMYDIDKAVNEEEYNERNKQHFLPETTDYHVQAINTPEPRFEVENGDRILSKSTSSSSSDLSRDHPQREIEEKVEDKEDYSDSGSSTPQSHDADPAFDVITRNSSPPILDTLDPYVIGFGQKIEPEQTIASIQDDVTVSKDWSSEDDVKLRNRSQPSSGCSQRSGARGGNRNECECSSSDDVETLEEKMDGRRRRSVISVLSNERILTSEIAQTPEKLLSNCPKDFAENGGSPLRSVDGSPKKTELLYSNFDDPDASAISPSRRNSRSSVNKLEFDHESEEHRDSSEERIIASILHDESCAFQSLEAIHSRRESLVADSPTIIIASRPHSNEALDLIENVNATNRLDDVDNARRFVEESEVNEMFEDGQSKDSASETNAEPGILKIESRSAEPTNSSKRMLSKVPRGKFRTCISKTSPEKPVKPKSAVQQCFSQLESKDWEITIKGLKALSQIAKLHPQQLDVSAAGTIGRLLGRHVKNLRSQVARAACMAAGDVFSSQIRGIDQDIDDIAGPLLHRTADTNRFLRADSNAALDRMIEHLPPHKTIGIIVHRGAKHQNAIVRAATARLLTEIVERVGAEHTMILPKDVRDKLLNAAAKLLIDGNLDARNYAKKIFRRLTGHDGFRKALTDAVPETTLRHIDKTLRTL